MSKCEHCGQTPCVKQWEFDSKGELKLLREQNQEFRAALELLLDNWPPHRDGMDYEIVPVGVRTAREVLAKWPKEKK